MASSSDSNGGGKTESARPRRNLSGRRKLLFACIVVPTLLVFLLAGLELFGWCFQPVPFHGSFLESFVLNHVSPPSGRYYHDHFVADNPDFREPYTTLTNAQGWVEDYDVTKEKPPGVYRVFYLGDSFTEGTAPMHQNLPSIVEAELNKLSTQRGAGVRFEVINTGTMSYSPLILFVLLRRVVLDYSPDLVVVQVDMTDDFDDWKYRQTAIYDENGDPWAVPPRDIYKSAYYDTKNGTLKASFWTRTQLFLAKHSHFYNYLVRRGGAGKEEDSLSPNTRPNTDEIYQRWSWTRWDWDKYTVRNVKQTLETLSKIAKLCKQNGIRLMITAVPHYPQYAQTHLGQRKAPWSNRPHIVIGEAAKAAGVPYLNSHAALQPYIEGTPQRRYYYHRNMHFNPRGYALWAKAQLSFLLDPKHGLLPASIYR